ncbi:MAG TPA: hypothetical protein VKH16_00080, partial [Gemmatimonadales bacterium]|nr:hypothetical protein [Gemmatimonadales bacterium]
WLEDRSLHVQQGIMTKRIRVGLIGANPDRGWAAQAHIPALQSLPDDFEITALSTCLPLVIVADNNPQSPRTLFHDPISGLLATQMV